MASNNCTELQKYTAGYHLHKLASLKFFYFFFSILNAKHRHNGTWRKAVMLNAVETSLYPVNCPYKLTAHYSRIKFAVLRTISQNILGGFNWGTRFASSVLAVFFLDKQCNILTCPTKIALLPSVTVFFFLSSLSALWWLSQQAQYGNTVGPLINKLKRCIVQYNSTLGLLLMWIKVRRSSLQTSDSP